ncbi:MAG: pyruvate:ferredoxin (flavodoxin) oxidoreductase [Clostridia bacterium]|nr:pyruvate:ferredoxin (flavodoxin) oxidoreductase [Clostridia bacterium]
MAKITVDGNTAAASIAYKFSDAATIYPITPSSTMAELCDKWASEGKKNIFGNIVKVTEMQSEGGAAGALHGSLSGGALTTTFTASQGLLLMIPNMYKIAGELTPCVMHVSARALATHALSIFGDHSDVMAIRQTGWAMLASSSVQEAMDMALVAHLATLKSSVPFVHFFDGFRTSHEINSINDIDDESIMKLVPWDKINEFRSRCLNSANPHQQGTAQNPDIYFQNREACNKYYNAVPGIVQETMDEVAKITGRKYKVMDYYGAADAESVIVMMGSGSSTCKLTIDYLNSQGKKYGMVNVRLYRPFDTESFLKVLPKTVKRVAVLDRTKEPGADGEPLYKDVKCALYDSKVTVIGGRYGLGSKEFTPSMVGAVLDNLESANPKNNFTVGIDDDVTNLSLTINKNIYPSDSSVTECKFYGFGGDGTVSANKSSIKIIGNNTEYSGQAYFEYDSKKSGNATISHIRFGKNELTQSYLLDNIDFISVHNQTYVTKYNLLKNVKDGATMLLNTEWDLKGIETYFPASLKKEIATKNIKLYTIDANAIAKELGLGNKINLIMQSAFFKLINIMPYDKAVSEMKDFAKKSYAKAGEEALKKNYTAIDLAGSKITGVNYPTTWANVDIPCDVKNTDTCVNATDKYYNEIIKPIQRLDGDDLKVSQFDERGFVPTDTTKYEKRGIATELPCWNSENCIQCNQCAFVCPHAAIRPYLVEDKDLADKPEDVKTLNALAEKNKQFILQVSSKDCTGCGVCAKVCPAKNKALTMVDSSDIMESEDKKYNYVSSLPKAKSDVFKPNTLKGSQYQKPYFEFSGACAGCGETPYVKLLSQLFGDHMVIANATGCSSIYGGSAPACPYAKDEDGYGVAWGNSLFEDNAEFGLGIASGLEINHNELQKALKEVLEASDNDELKALINKYFAATDAKSMRVLGKAIVEIIKSLGCSRPACQKVLALQDHFAKNSIWILGGDGWAYDIGYGGLDHVLASGENINILVLDTEVYSNTGGQSSKSTPLGAVAKFAANGKRTNKKDLGIMATTYKDVYVAKVAMGADMNQLVKAMTEAEAYNGVSLIIAYAPCINHGINMTNSQGEMKKAVESGYWHLWRYNPTLDHPFILDSKEPTLDYEEFLKGENRYKSLIAKDENLAKELFAEAKANAKKTYDYYKSLSEK